LDDLAGLRAAAARIAGGYGLELFDLQFRRESIGWVLRVILDRPTAPGGADEDAVSIDDCRRVSEDLSVRLDVEPELLGAFAAGLEPDARRARGGYTLEVSSPGLDRPLRGEADYRRFVGRLAKIVTREPVAGQSHFAGRLGGVEGGEVVVQEGRRTHRVPLAAIDRGRLDVEF
jgi:ribosome maturation factor RimP